MIDSPDKFPLDFGEQVVVLGAVAEQFRPTVSYMEWLSHESRWEIELLWENGDNSRIYSSDRGKYWIPAKEYKPKVWN